MSSAAGRFALSLAVATMLVSPGLVVAAAPVAAERLEVRYERGNFTLVSRTPVTKVLPPSAPEPPEPSAGYWFELRSADGQTRYRVLTPDPVRLVYEGSADGRLERVEGVPEERVMVVLVPAPEPGDQLVLIGSPLMSSTLRAAATEIFRLPIEVLP